MPVEPKDFRGLEYYICYEHDLLIAHDYVYDYDKHHQRTLTNKVSSVYSHYRNEDEDNYYFFLDFPAKSEMQVLEFFFDEKIGSLHSVEGKFTLEEIVSLMDRVKKMKAFL